MSKRKTDTRYITLLSVISAFAVINIHTNVCFGDFRNDLYWQSANIIKSICDCAVPIFFMISGVTLMDYRKRYNTRTYFVKRFKKTVIPFLAWGFLGILCYLFYRHKVQISLSSLSFIIIQGTSWYSNFYGTYWFFAPLFVSYATIPLLAYVDENKRKNLFKYLLVLCFISNSLVPFITSIIPFFNTSLSFTLGSEYVFYVILGYMINKYEPSRKQEIIAYVVAFVSIVIQIAGTYYASLNAGEVISTYRGNLNPFSIFWAVGIFIFFKKHGNNIMNIKPLEKFIKFLGKYTFGIYLLHWNVMYFFGKLVLVYPYGDIIYRFVGPFVIMPVCVLMVFILRKIPLIKHTVP